MGSKTGNGLRIAAIGTHAVHIKTTTVFAEVKQAATIGAQDWCTVFTGIGSEFFVGIVHGIIHPYIAGNGTVLVFAPNVLTTFLIVVVHNNGVFAKTYIFGRRGQYLLRPSTRNRNTIQFGHVAGRVLPVVFIILPLCAKHNVFSIGGKCIRMLRIAMKSESFGFATCSRHHKHIKIAKPVAGKSYHAAIRAPHGFHFMRLMQRKRYSISSLRSNFVQIAFVTKYNGAAIGAYGGVAHPKRFGLGDSGMAKQE